MTLIDLKTLILTPQNVSKYNVLKKKKQKTVSWSMDHVLCQPPKTHVIVLKKRPGYTNVLNQIFQFLYSPDGKICYSHFPGLGKILSGQGVLEEGLIWQHLWT